MKSVTENLFEEYQKIRSSELSLVQFKILMRLYPSLLVCMSDGQYNTEEQIGMHQNLRSHVELLDLASREEKEKMFLKLRDEMEYLSGQVDCWKNQFLSAIRFELMMDPEDKEFIMESLYLFANIHDGICIEEQLQIDELVNELHLTI